MENPKIEICSFSPDRKWVRVEGEVTLEKSNETNQAMLDANPMLQRMYYEEDNLMAAYSFAKVQQLLTALQKLQRLKYYNFRLNDFE